MESHLDHTGRTNDRVADQMEIPVLLVMEEIVAVVQEVMLMVPQERVQRRTEHFADVPVPQFAAETVEVVRLDPLERVQQRTSGQNEDVPQFPEETVEMMRLVPGERVHRRANCGGAYCINFGGHCRRVQDCTTGAI